MDRDTPAFLSALHQPALSGASLAPAKVVEQAVGCDREGVALRGGADFLKEVFGQ